MDHYYTQVIWYVNNVLFLFAVIVGTILILYRLVKEKTEALRRRRIKEIHNDLQAIMKLGKDKTAIHQCVSLMKKIAPAELFEMVHQKSIAPFMLSKEMALCIHSSERDYVSENIAQHSRNKWGRIKALLVIGHLGSPNALRILSAAIENKDSDIAYFSILALAQIKNAASGSVIFDALRKRIVSGYKIAAILEDFPEEEIENLSSCLDDSDALIRFWALKTFGQHKLATKYIPEITRLIHDHNADVRAAAYECLGSAHDASVASILQEGLKDGEWFVRLHALRALEKIDKESVLSSMLVLLGDSHWHIREEAKNILMKHMNCAVSYVEALMVDGDPNVRAYCLEIIQQSGYVVTILRNAIRDDESIRAKAMQLLKVVVEAGAHFSLEEACESLREEEREKALNQIAVIDAGKAAHIKMKLEKKLCKP